MELVDNTCSMHRDTHNHWKIYVWLTFEFRLLCFSFSLHKLLLQCLKLLNTGNEYQSLRKAICFRPHYTFKVQENSSTFQGLTKKLSTFQGKEIQGIFKTGQTLETHDHYFVTAPFYSSPLVMKWAQWPRVFIAVLEKKLCIVEVVRFKI